MQPKTAWAWIAPDGKIVRLWPWKPTQDMSRIEAFYGKGKLIEVKVEVKE